jgi:N-acetylmuramic acid 6-phosphate etherase
MDLDRLPLAEALARMQANDSGIHTALEAARPQILRAIELAVAALKAGGRMFYVGAGTSGRLGVLDAAELPPTFQTDPALVQGLIAGGERALTAAVEGIEDDADAGQRDLRARGLAARDWVLGIAAGGTTPYVHGALDYARSLGAKTVFLACVPRAQVSDRCEVSIRVVTGPEFLTGSTRLKAGTATKLVLNAISTLTMVQLGKVRSNLMVDLNATGNEKLRDRARRIFSELTGASPERAAAALEAAGGSLKLALERELPH